MNENLYDGLSGMALYYFSLYKHYKDEKYLSKSLNILSDIKQNLNAQNLPIGAFDGAFSAAFHSGSASNDGWPACPSTCLPHNSGSTTHKEETNTSLSSS